MESFEDADRRMEGAKVVFGLECAGTVELLFDDQQKSFHIVDMVTSLLEGYDGDGGEDKAPLQLADLFEQQAARIRAARVES